MPIPDRSRDDRSVFLDEDRKRKESGMLKGLSKSVSSLTSSVATLAMTVGKGVSKPIVGTAKSMYGKMDIQPHAGVGRSVAAAANPFLGLLAEVASKESSVHMARGFKSVASSSSNFIKGMFGSRQQVSHKNEAPASKRISATTAKVKSESDKIGAAVNKKGKRRLSSNSYNRIYGSETILEAVDRLRITNAEWMKAVHTLSPEKLKSKQLPRAESGGYVTRSGQAIVHRGELIVPEKAIFEQAVTLRKIEQRLNQTLKVRIVDKRGKEGRFEQLLDKEIANQKLGNQNKILDKRKSIAEMGMMRKTFNLMVNPFRQEVETSFAARTVNNLEEIKLSMGEFNMKFSQRIDNIFNKLLKHHPFLFSIYDLGKQTMKLFRLLFPKKKWPDVRYAHDIKGDSSTELTSDAAIRTYSFIREIHEDFVKFTKESTTSAILQRESYTQMIHHLKKIESASSRQFEADTIILEFLNSLRKSGGAGDGGLLPMKRLYPGAIPGAKLRLSSPAPKSVRRPDNAMEDLKLRLENNAMDELKLFFPWLLGIPGRTGQRIMNRIQARRERRERRDLGQLPFTRLLPSRNPLLLGEKRSKNVEGKVDVTKFNTTNRLLFMISKDAKERGGTLKAINKRSGKISSFFFTILPVIATAILTIFSKSGLLTVLSGVGSIIASIARSLGSGIGTIAKPFSAFAGTLAASSAGRWIGESSFGKGAKGLLASGRDQYNSYATRFSSSIKSKEIYKRGASAANLMATRLSAAKEAGRASIMGRGVAAAGRGVAAAGQGIRGTKTVATGIKGMTGLMGGARAASKGLLKVGGKFLGPLSIILAIIDGIMGWIKAPEVFNMAYPILSERISAALGGMVSGLLDIIRIPLNLLGQYLWGWGEDKIPDLFAPITKGIHFFVSHIQPLYDSLGRSIIEFGTFAWGLLQSLGELIKAIPDIWNNPAKFFDVVWKETKKTLSNFIGGLWRVLIDSLKAVLPFLIKTLKITLVGFGYLLGGAFYLLLKGLKRLFWDLPGWAISSLWKWVTSGKVLKDMGRAAVGLWGVFKDIFDVVAVTMYESFVGEITWMTNVFTSIWTLINDAIQEKIDKWLNIFKPKSDPLVKMLNEAGKARYIESKKNQRQRLLGRGWMMEHVGLTVPAPFKPTKEELASGVTFAQITPAALKKKPKKIVDWATGKLVYDSPAPPPPLLEKRIHYSTTEKAKEIAENIKKMAKKAKTSAKSWAYGTAEWGKSKALGLVDKLSTSYNKVNKDKLIKKITSFYTVSKEKAKKISDIVAEKYGISKSVATGYIVNAMADPTGDMSKVILTAIQSKKQLLTYYQTNVLKKPVGTMSLKAWEGSQSLDIIKSNEAAKQIIEHVKKYKDYTAEQWKSLKEKTPKVYEKYKKYISRKAKEGLELIKIRTHKESPSESIDTPLIGGMQQMINNSNSIATSVQHIVNNGQQMDPLWKDDNGLRFGKTV